MRYPDLTWADGPPCRACSTPTLLVLSGAWGICSRCWGGGQERGAFIYTSAAITAAPDHRPLRREVQHG